jgi:hypothetical protein
MCGDWGGDGEPLTTRDYETLRSILKSLLVAAALAEIFAWSR